MDPPVAESHSQVIITSDKSHFLPKTPEVGLYQQGSAYAKGRGTLFSVLD